MDLNKVYYDDVGGEINILQAVKSCPEWAANRIQVGEKWQEIVTDCERIFGTPDTADAPHMSNLPNLVRDLKARNSPDTKESTNNPSEAMLCLYELSRNAKNNHEFLEPALKLITAWYDAHLAQQGEEE